ncbi:hypothetical protein N7454_004611 [Penicillium verhagenii]|nr:hypothetical protein N7454_004974 [Penicillium verhagenii]KAJ5938269.1 hypothetical protein N7454_004611 [Penicillium verhagenii]
MGPDRRPASIAQLGIQLDRGGAGAELVASRPAWDGRTIIDYASFRTQTFHAVSQWRRKRHEDMNFY